VSTVDSISVSGLSSFYHNASVNPAPQVESDDSSSPDASALQQARPHHHHGHGGAEMFQKLQSAVTTALQAAQSDGSSDPNQVVEDAIQKVLAGKSDSSGQGNSQASSNDGSGDQAASATDSSQNAPDSRQAFFDTLKSYGIDPQQFHADFVAAVKQAKEGQADPSSAFQSFPPGTLVDSTG
jgi:hypothetical protein